MNIYDTDIKSKMAARDLIEALHGLSVQSAEQMLGLVEVSIINGQTFHPNHIERYRDKIVGLGAGPALQAVRLARYVIMNHTEVDMNSEATATAFNLWSKEAALVGARLTA